MGSRGANTYSAPPSTTTAPGVAQPMQRSTAAPQAGAARGAGAAAPRSGFMGGLMGGLIGAGLIGMLFGGGLFGGLSGLGGFLGLLLQVFLVVMVVRFLYRRFRPAQPAAAGGPSLFARGAEPTGGAAPGGGAPGGIGAAFAGLRGGAAAASAPPVTIGPDDYQRFEQLLQSVQAAWTARDLDALGKLSTAEMRGYFAEQLAEQASRNEQNSVTEVRLQQGDLSEAWSERGRDYATVAMKFSMVDVTRDAAGNIVDGSPDEHVTATELWSFVRLSGDDNWVLSAIQQVR